MIVLNKKRIIFVTLALMFSIVFVSFNRVDIKDGNTIFTSSVPVSGYTIILDAGHGQPDRAERQIWREYLKRKLI